MSKRRQALKERPGAQVAGAKLPGAAVDVNHTYPARNGMFGRNPQIGQKRLTGSRAGTIRDVSLVRNGLHRQRQHRPAAALHTRALLCGDFFLPVGAKGLREPVVSFGHLADVSQR